MDNKTFDQKPAIIIPSKLWLKIVIAMTSENNMRMKLMPIKTSFSKTSAIPITRATRSIHGTKRCHTYNLRTDHS